MSLSQLPCSGFRERRRERRRRAEETSKPNRRLIPLVSRGGAEDAVFQASEPSRGTCEAGRRKASSSRDGEGRSVPSAAWSVAVKDGDVEAGDICSESVVAGGSASSSATLLSLMDAFPARIISMAPKSLSACSSHRSRLAANEKIKWWVKSEDQVVERRQGKTKRVPPFPLNDLFGK